MSEPTTMTIKIVDPDGPPPVSQQAAASSSSPPPRDDRRNTALDEFFAAPPPAPVAPKYPADMRRNTALDEFMGMGGGAKPKKVTANHPGEGEQATAAKTGVAADTQVETVNFPTTVIGLDGKTYTLEAYEEAKARAKRSKESAESKAADDAFFPKNKAGKIGPDTANVNGQKIGADAYEAAQRRLDGEKKKKDADAAYDALNPSLKAPDPKKQPPPLPGEKIKAQAEGNVMGMIDPGGMVRQGADLIGGGAMKMGGMAAVGAALPLVAAAAQQVTSAFQNVKKNVDMVGDSLATFAGNERAGLGQLADGATAAMRAPAESIPIVGDAIKAQNEAMDAITKLPEKLTVAFMAQGQKLSAYSGAITGANAQADVRQIMADFKEAQDMGDSYAQMIDAQSRLDNTVREIVMPIKKFIVEVLAERLSFLADVAQIVANLPAILNIYFTGLGDAIVNGVTLHFEAAFESLKKIAADIRDLMKKQNKQPNDFFNTFFNDVKAVKFDGKAFAG